MVMVCGVFGNAEIIKFSKLSKEKKEFSFKRDIFFPKISSSPNHDVIIKEARKLLDEKNSDPRERVNKEVRQAVFFEGYVEKKNRIIALVSANGEFFTVGEGDVFMDRIKVIKIERDKLILDVESQQIEIQLKGDDND